MRLSLTIVFARHTMRPESFRRLSSMTTRHRVQLALILLTAVVVTGTAGFHYIEGWSWFDGFYMILTTMTTIGYGEVHPLSHVGAFSIRS